MNENVIRNLSHSRFELNVSGHIAFADYRQEGQTLIIPHVEAPPVLRGTGAAGRLMEGIAAIARAEGLKILPLCSYAAAWIERHPDQHDLLKR